MLDFMTMSSAFVRNGRTDVVAANPLARALFVPMFDGEVDEKVARIEVEEERHRVRRRTQAPRQLGGYAGSGSGYRQLLSLKRSRPLLNPLPGLKNQW
jgi:hypothetical protein